jgi:hypothetical protein
MALANRLGAVCGPVSPGIELAVQQGSVLTTRQLIDAGLSPSQIHRRAARGQWTRCGPGARTAINLTHLEAGEAPEVEIRKHCLLTAAALLRRPGHAAGGASMAILHGLPVMTVPDLPQLIAPEPATTGRRAGAHVRRGNPPPAERADWFGVPGLTVAATVLDLACLDPRSGLMAADAALHERLLTPAALAATVADAPPRRGVRRAREVLALADERIESPLESLTHLALHDSGFPPPDLQTLLIGGDGRRYRVDFYWPEHNLILEADGLSKYRKQGFGPEKRRERMLRRAKFHVERVIWSEVIDTWPETAAALWDEYFRPTR